MDYDLNGVNVLRPREQIETPFHSLQEIQNLFKNTAELDGEGISNYKRLVTKIHMIHMSILRLLA